MLKIKPDMKYDAERVLKEHMPNLIKLLGEQKIGWTSVNEILKKRINMVREDIKSTGAPVERDATFHSIIVNKIKGNGKADGMFDFLNKLFGSLNEILSPEEKKLIHGIIKNALTEADRNYLNFIGELGTLNDFMRTGNYNLLNIEEPIHQGKNISADIFLRRKDEDIKILIEVLNLHLEIKEFESFATLEYHLRSKIDDKKAKKNLINPTRIIFIQPVVWTKDENQLAFVCEFYSKNDFKIDNVLTPMAYATYKLKNGDFEHHFESINTILSN